jgi:hypothetical protein
MKPSLTFILMILFKTLLSGCIAQAQTAVQRAAGSSITDYQKYLESREAVSFVDAYINLSASLELNIPVLEQCLEEVYVKAPFEDTCLTAVKSLTSMPLNKFRREILSSFLTKLVPVTRKHKHLYQSLLTGLNNYKSKKTHKNDHEKKETETISQLEMKAWKKAISRMIDLEDSALLINGIRIADLKSWVAPNGIFQWSLITNTHAPLTRLSSFHQFAVDSIKEIQELYPKDCGAIAKTEPKAFGIVKLEIFHSRQCVLKEEVFTQNRSRENEHLTPGRSLVNLEKKSNRHWTWIGVAVGVVATGLYLKDKNVQVSLPSFKMNP